MEVIKAHAGGGLAPALDALQVGDGNLTATPSGTGTAEVGQGVRLFYGLGAIAFGINHAALGSLVMMFFNQVVGLPARWVGTAIALALVFDGIFDPLLGQWSDHVNSRWGRRHPFMYASAIPIAAAFYFLWNPPLGLSEHQMFYYLLAMLIALRLSVSLYEIPSAALAPELTPDYDERTTLLSYRFFFGMMGGGTMAVLAFQVFLRKDAAHPLGVLNRAGYGAYGLTAAVVMLITILISCFGTHGRGMVITEPRKHSDFAGRIQQIKTTFSNQSLVALMVAALIAGTAGGLGAGLSLYIATYFWELSPHEISFLVASGAIAAVLAVGLAPVVSKRMGKKRAMITVFIMAMIADVIPIPLRLVGLMPANHTRALLAALLADGIVRDTLGVMGFIIVASMVADIVEDIAVQTGKRSEGLLFAANGLLLKWVTAIGTFASGLLLEFSHFPQGATPGNVDPLILRHLVLIFVPFTACCHAMAITALTFYRIDRTTHQHNLDRLRDAAAVAELVTEKAGEDAAALPP